MNGNIIISNALPALFIVGAGVTLAALYNESRERGRLLLAMMATMIACYSLAILCIEHLH